MTATMPKIKARRRPADKKLRRVGQDPFIPARNPYPFGDYRSTDPSGHEALPQKKQRRGIFSWLRRRQKK
jgi:hypothetical protein